MKILLGNNTLDIQAGSETYTLTLAAELKRLGHDVTAYSPQLGFIATQLEALDIRCVSAFKQNENPLKFSLGLQDTETEYDFDVIICAHNQITKDLHKAFPDVPIIAVVHGIMHEGPQGEIYPEHPVTEFKVDQYVAVSPEVQGLLREVYGIDSVIITNFFDLEKFNWNPVPPEAGDVKSEHTIALKKPEMFLINTNYLAKDDPQVQTVIEVAKHFGAGLKAVGANFTPSWELNDMIKDVDVVVGMGRSVLEGFVMGKISLVQGRWGTGGVITPDTYEKLRESNFSGRSSNGKYATAQEIIEQIEKALTTDQLDWQKATVLENHDVKVAAKQFLEIAEELTNGKAR